VSVLYRESDGTSVLPDLGEELGAGGQARVVGVAGHPDLVAKLYHAPAEQHARKLRVMLAHPPVGGDGAARSLVWPADLLRDEQGRTVGVLMPRINGMQRAFELYNPLTRRAKSPLFDYARLHRTARNVAAAFDALHAAGYVVGDANESNVLVDDAGNVTVIDTDSFQVRDPATGDVFRCPVGRPEFAPPELQGKTLSEIDRTVEHDRFALGVLIFQLLMEGTHPFAGQYLGPGEPPDIPQRIARGIFPYRPGGLLRPPRNAPPFDVLHPIVRVDVHRCFEVGHFDPAGRPTAAEWVTALEAAAAALVQCRANPLHRYGNHLDRCPWCERADALGGRDPFPSAEAVARGEHLRTGRRGRVARPASTREAPSPAALLGIALAPAWAAGKNLVGRYGPQVRSAVQSAFSGFSTGGKLALGFGVALAVSALVQSWLPLGMVALAAAGEGVHRLTGRSRVHPLIPIMVIAAALVMVGSVPHDPVARPPMPTPAPARLPAWKDVHSTAHDPNELTVQPVRIGPAEPGTLDWKLTSDDFGADVTYNGVLAFDVLPDGRVDLGSLRSMPEGWEFPDEARATLARWVFRPGEMNGVPVPVTLIVPISWTRDRVTIWPGLAPWAKATTLPEVP
jgi:hypothetical protein